MADIMGDSGDIVHFQEIGNYNRLYGLFARIRFLKYFLPLKEISSNW